MSWYHHWHRYEGEGVRAVGSVGIPLGWGKVGWEGCKGLQEGRLCCSV